MPLPPCPITAFGPPRASAPHSFLISPGCSQPLTSSFPCRCPWRRPTAPCAWCRPLRGREQGSGGLEVNSIAHSMVATCVLEASACTKPHSPVHTCNLAATAPQKTGSRNVTRQASTQTRTTQLACGGSIVAVAGRLPHRRGRCLCVTLLHKEERVAKAHGHLQCEKGRAHTDQISCEQAVHDPLSPGTGSRQSPWPPAVRRDGHKSISTPFSTVWISAPARLRSKRPGARRNGVGVHPPESMCGFMNNVWACLQRLRALQRHALVGVGGALLAAGPITQLAARRDRRRVAGRERRCWRVHVHGSQVQVQVQGSWLAEAGAEP